MLWRQHADRVAEQDWSRGYKRAVGRQGCNAKIVLHRDEPFEDARRRLYLQDHVDVRMGVREARQELRHDAGGHTRDADEAELAGPIFADGASGLGDLLE